MVARREDRRREGSRPGAKARLEGVIIETKKRAEKIQQSSDAGELEPYLTERRIQIDRQYEYKYSVLILVFGNLICQGMLSEQELQGLNQDKLDSIRRYAKLEFSAELKLK
jgi:hypothetical protein